MLLEAARICCSRDSRKPGGGALVAALALTFCGPVMSLLDVSNNLTTFAWVPLIVWCALSEVPAMTCGAVMALSFLAGERSSHRSGRCFSSSSGGADGWTSSKPRRWRSRYPPCSFFPFLCWIANSDRARGGMTRAHILSGSMAPRDWFRLAIPPKPDAVFDPSMGQQFLPILYAGLLTILLAIIGIFAARRRAAAGRRSFF